MFRTSLPLFGVAALALALPAPTEARPQGRGQQGPPPLAHVVERHADELGLDAATLDQVIALQEQARSDQGELRESIRSARETLRSMMESDSPDEAAVIAQVESLGELQTQAHVARIRTDLQVRSLLTAEQFQALEELRPERQQRGQRGGFDRQGQQGSGGQGQGFSRPQRGGFGGAR